MIYKNSICAIYAYAARVPPKLSPTAEASGEGLSIGAAAISKNSFQVVHYPDRGFELIINVNTDENLIREIFGKI